MEEMDGVQSILPLVQYESVTMTYEEIRFFHRAVLEEWLSAHPPPVGGWMDE